MGTHPIFESDFDCLTDMSSSEEPKRDDYSARLAKLKARVKVDTSQSSSSTSSSARLTEDMARECREAISSGCYDDIIAMAKDKIATDIYAQRIVVNELVLAYNTKSKKANDVIGAFKTLSKNNTTVVAFYLFMAEIYRLHNHIDGAKATLSLIATYNDTEESKSIRDKYFKRLDDERRIVSFEVSDQIGDFIVLGARRQLRVRNSMLPRMPSQQRNQDDSEDDEEEEKQRAKGSRTDNPRKRVAFEQKENSEHKKTVPETPKMKPPNMKVRHSSVHRTPGPSGTVTRERRTNSSLIEVNGESYEIYEKLGQGGFSKVYKCMDTTDKRNVRALKYVDLAKVDRASEKGILNEIEHLTQLNGAPNIISMYNHEIRDRKLFIVLEYGELDCAKYLHKKKGSLSCHMVKSLWEQMVRAVAAVHERGIIHRDLKPCNFLLCEGEIKLIDFGIANTIASDVTSMETDMVGTLNYMSPEQLQETDEGSRSAKVGKWTDSWSLGCILYLMAYQKLPFEEFKSTPMKVTKIIDESYQISFPPHSCPGLVAMLKICLDRSPKRRMMPSDILTSFFYSNNLSELIKYLDDEQFQDVYSTCKKLMC